MTTVISASGRLSASQIRDLSSSQRDLNLPATAENEIIPIVYGENSLKGDRRIFATGSLSGDLVLGIAWCYGEIESVVKVYINDEDVPVGVTQTHYTGTTSQVVDPTLASAIAAYADDMILRTPDGDIGIAYTVLRIPPGEIDSLSSIRAVVQGRKVYDPRSLTTVYSANSALCAADFASNAIFGMGKTVVGADTAADFNDELIDSFERCRLNLAITEPRSSADYLDLLCMYAECVWFPEGDSIRIKPDRLIGADNPCGLDIVTNPGFDTDTDWTKGTGWSIASGVASSDGTQVAESSLSQTLTTEDAVKYAVSVTVSARSAGSVRVEWGGGEIIGAQTSADTFTYCVLASGTSNDLDIIASADFVGSIDEVTVKRLYWHETKVVAGSLQISGLDDADSPTRVYARYTNPSSVSAAWPLERTSVSLPGYDTGDVPPVDTTIQLPGVHREAEASNKANARLQRMVNRVRASWITKDHGIIHQLADVVQLDRPKYGVDILVWVDSIEMVDYGRYRVSGMRYDESHYPTELALPDNVGVVPVGAIVFNSGTDLPAGWANYADADGRFLVGAGGALSVGDTGGADTHGGFTGDTSEESTHGPSPSYSTYLAIWNVAGSDSFSTVDSVDNPDMLHSHTYTTGVITPDPFRRDIRLMQKITAATTEFPAQAQILGLNGLLAPTLSRLTTAAGRLLKAASANADGGVATQSVNFTSGDADDAHTHSTFEFGDRRNPLNPLTTLYTEAQGGGIHSHDYSLTLARNIKRRRIAMYGGTDDFPVLPGTIVLWAGSLASLPTDWVLCDGANLTPDLRDHFIEVSGIGDEETAEGDNTIAIDGDGSNVGHQHKSGGSTSNRDKRSLRHDNVTNHTHSISRSDSWTPPYYALAAIMFAPS